MTRKVCIVLVFALIVLSVASCCSRGKEAAAVPVTRMETPPQPMVQAPPPQPPPQRVVEVPPVPESVFFALSESEITPGAAVTLRNQAEFLKQNPDRKVQISGNTDERGSQEYNEALGQRRADAVKEHLVGLGVSEDRMTTTSYGKDKPVCEESTESCHAANRRVDLSVTG